MAGKRSPIAEFYLDPVRVVWQSEQGVSDTRTLLAPQPGQPVRARIRLGELASEAMAELGGKQRIDGMRFLDWPSSPNQAGVTAGLQAILVMTLDSGTRRSA